MNELWKPVTIKPFDTFYEVSNLGRIRRSKDGHCTYAGKIMKQTLGSDGYFRAKLSNKSKATTQRVNRLVALAFIPNPENKVHTNHIDCNKLNNRVENLEWNTRKENGTHASINGCYKIGSKHGQSKLTEAQVKEIKATYKKGRGGGYRLLAAKYGVTQRAIACIIKGLTWSHV